MHLCKMNFSMGGDSEVRGQSCEGEGINSSYARDGFEYFMRVRDPS